MCKLCVNCGAPATCEHHIVPIALGGNDIPSNKVPLCDKCHGAIHSVSFGEGCLSHGELIRRGLQKKKDAISRGEVYRARSGRISSRLGGRPLLQLVISHLALWSVIIITTTKIYPTLQKSAVCHEQRYINISKCLLNN